MRELHRVVIPDAVAEELERRPGPRVDRTPESHRRRRSPGGIGTTRSGRRRARSLGVPITGTLGVLLALHRAGYANRRFAEDLDALDAAGMYLTPDLKRRVMELLHAGEAPKEEA